MCGLWGGGGGGGMGKAAELHSCILADFRQWPLSGLSGSQLPEVAPGLFLPISLARGGGVFPI